MESTWERIVGIMHIGYLEVILQPRSRTAAEDKLTIRAGA